MDPATPVATPEDPLDARAVRAAKTSVIVASGLGAIKLVAAVFTGSLALAASFVDSLMDVFASSVNLVAVRIGGRPADDEHRYGHGKAESLAGMFQGSVVGFSGVYLVIESVRHLRDGATPTHGAWGIAVMVVSTLASLWVTRLLRRAARSTGSVALSADSVHYASDVWMNLGVLVALVVVRFTDHAWVDPATGLAVAALVLKGSWNVLRASLDELMDRDLGADVERTILEAVSRDVPEARAIREVKTRRAGRRRFVDLTVAFDRGLRFAAAHRLSERVKTAVRAAVPGAQVQVHADPHPLRPDDHPDEVGDDVPGA